MDGPLPWYVKRYTLKSREGFALTSPQVTPARPRLTATATSPAALADVPTQESVSLVDGQPRPRSSGLRLSG
jgi:hypothetical protein